MPNPVPDLAAPWLELQADILLDIEKVRIANVNRFDQLVGNDPDKDGEVRGRGLPLDHSAVKSLTGIIRILNDAEEQAEKDLTKEFKKHPLYELCADIKGMGPKQTPRLLAVIGDPYWNVLHDRPRTLRELWAYCGLHNVPAHYGDADHTAAGGDVYFVAARRQRGQKANWSTEAKVRAYLIAEKMLQVGNRAMYDDRQAQTVDRVHSAPCAPCGQKGKPAQPGTPWKPGHRRADALRIVSKNGVLRPLWEEARRIHLEKTGEPATEQANVA